MLTVCEHPQHACIHASIQSCSNSSLHWQPIHSSIHACIDRACKVERQLMQGGKAAHARSKRSMCKGKRRHLLAQGNFFKQGLGAWGQVGLSQALRRLGVWAQQFCLEVLTLYPHGIKSACTNGTLNPKPWLACHADCCSTNYIRFQYMWL